MDALHPYKPTSNTKTASGTRSFKVGERIQSRKFRNNKYVWIFGIVLKKWGALHYLIQLDTGQKLKRHVDQLRSTLVKQVRFNTETEMVRRQPQIKGIPGLNPIVRQEPQSESEPDPQDRESTG